MGKITLLIVAFFCVGCAGDKYFYNGNQKIELSPVETLKRSNSNVDYYTTENDIKLGVTNKLLVKFTNNSNLEAYLSEFDLTLIKQLEDNLYLLQTQYTSLTLDISNSLNNKDDVEFAHPDFIKKMKLR